MDLKIRDFEITILKSLRGISSSFLDTLMQIITMMGEEYVLIGVIAILYFLYLLYFLSNPPENSIYFIYFFIIK